jgi:two-component system response regulator YesN
MLLDQSFSRPLTLRDAATEVDLHPDYLSRRFKLETGIGFHEYLLTVRLQHATTLLVTSTKSIKEIAYEVGFRAPEVFSKAFTRFFSCAPSVYRNHNLVFYGARSLDPSRTGLPWAATDPERDRTDLADCIVDCGERV